MSNDQNNLATVQALSNIGGANSLVGMITERESAKRLFDAVTRLAEKIASEHSFRQPNKQAGKIMLTYTPEKAINKSRNQKA